MEPTQAQLGAVIRHLRTKRELTVEGLAATAGIHWTYLSGIERGRRNPTWKVLAAIARSLDVEISELARLAEELADQDKHNDKRRARQDSNL
ncbi:MAG TPA: helix-turn-helix transcriptional regulator [Solirubrobacterales bacterium]|nr:helix-turn-helix transcriptional regulator [Solirubrobacterales bacterium]